MAVGCRTAWIPHLALYSLPDELWLHVATRNPSAAYACSLGMTLIGFVNTSGRTPIQERLVRLFGVDRYVS